ncbi:hypothetical protein PG985_009555 [Apiospora marii]|uniref:Glycosyltransferase n=1 Tax=Apiospora marii TaxID=335849 RepID=A0ABR1RFK1_9PEZI
MPPTTILFLTNSELGQASVMLAVAAEVARTPDSRTHLGSFSPLAPEVPDGVLFHTLPGPSMKQVFAMKGKEFLPRHRPGLTGTPEGFAEAYSRVLAPWDEADFFSIFDACCQLLKDIHPSLVVLDPLLGAAYDACVFLKRRHIILTPNTLKDHATGSQPGLEGLYKLPCLGSGYSLPLGPVAALCNAYLLLALHIYGHWSVSVKRLDRARHQRGISWRLGTISLFDDVRPDLIVLLQSVPEIDFPLTVPSNLLGCGPILPAYSPLSETHGELAAWLNRGPTIVVNMGSHVTQAVRQAAAILAAVVACLRRRASLQVLWKLQPADAVVPDLPAGLAARLRIVPWLPSTPAAVLTASPSILAYVHHGGSNSFHEAVAAGVPHVVCPVWLDTYDFATRVEHLGIGVCGNRGHAPEVDSAGLEQALEEVGFGAGVAERREKARGLAEVVGGVNAGRSIAASRVMDAARY